MPKYMLLTTAPEDYVSWWLRGNLEEGETFVFGGVFLVWKEFKYVFAPE